MNASRDDASLGYAEALTDRNSLESVVENLRAALARDRDEANLLRADIASVAMSLEHGKHQLDTMLHDESDRFSHGGRQLGHGADRAANAATDAEIARSLESQLRATLETLSSAEQEERKLLKEIASLKTLDAVFQSAEEDSDGEDDLESLVDRFTDGLTLAASSASHASAHDRLAAWTWRERTLPSVSLVADADPDRGTPRNIQSGVVAERIFEDCVVFARRDALAAQSNGNAIGSPKEDDCILLSAEALLPVPESEMLVIAPQYAALTVQDLSAAHGLRLVALSSALQSVRQFIEPHQCTSRQEGTSSASKSLQPTSKDRSDGGKPVVLDGGKVVKALSITALPSPEAAARFLGRGSAVGMIDPPPTTSHKSAVLSSNQFARVLAAAPSRFHDHDLQRIYSTAVDGISLGTLYRMVKGFEPTLVCLSDTKGHAIGCLAPSAWRDTSKLSCVEL
jgi:hypothetical protein